MPVVPMMTPATPATPAMSAPPAPPAPPATHRTRAPDGARLAFIHTRGPRLCVRCGLVLEPPWWMTVFPHGEHEVCRDWSGRPFPFERHHDLLRKIARHVDDARRREILAIAAQLARLARTWPRDALVTLAASRVHIAAARPLVQGAPNKLTAQL